MMISVTQPRRPADDFLASLQANLQGNGRATRRRGQQRQTVADEPNKKTVVAKEQKRPRPLPQQKPNNVKGRNTESNKPVKQSTKPSVSHKALKRTAISSPENKSMISNDNGPPETYVKVVPEIVPPVLEQAPVVPQLSHQPAAEVVQAYHITPTYQHGPTQSSYQNPPPHQQGPRQSQNNFYLKNQSNIFNTGWHSYGNTTSSPRVTNPVVDNVVEKALIIASQQPLPPPPTLSARYDTRYHQENGKPVEETVLLNHNQIMTPQQHVPPLVPVTGSLNKPLNSHYTQSFSITGGVEQDTRAVQELERRRWILELEGQIKEKKEREQHEKLRRRSPYPAPPPPQYPTYSSVTPTYPTSQKPTAPNTFPQTNTHQMPQCQQGTQNANFSNVEPPQNIELSHQTSVQQQPVQSPMLVHKLGQHCALVDPLEQERRHEARRRALENQEIIRKQVEERERLKRVEQERIKWEEELEMRKIEEEKRRMAEEVRMEKAKARKKEQAQLEQIAEMRLKIEEANKSALELKRGKRSRSAAHNEPNANTPKVLETQSYAVQEVTEKKRSPEVWTNKPGRTLQKEPRATMVEIQGVEEQLTVTRPLQQTVLYISNASTQTVHEVSCQTVDREDSFLPAETKLIKLQERELSAVQRQHTDPSNRRTQSKQRSVTKPPIKKEKTRRVTEMQKVQYDNNGRRIRPTVQSGPPKEVTPTASNIIAEESVEVAEYTSIADIFDDPRPMSPIMEVESVGPSPFSIPDQQIQMRYISPHNEERTIPSAISARQNDILNQLEKLRMGLKDRRRHMSSVDNDQ